LRVGRVRIYRRQPRFIKKRTATMMTIAITATSTQFVNVMFYSKAHIMTRSLWRVKHITVAMFGTGQRCE
jgi:hypothetical protein